MADLTVPPLDPSRCPECLERFEPGAARCAACGFLLRGPAAAELWRVTTEIHRLMAERARLAALLRRPEAPPPPRPAPEPKPEPEYVPRAAEPAYVPRRPAPEEWAVTAPPAPRTPPPPTAAERARVNAAYATPTRTRPPKPRREWTPQRVQNLLLATGVLLTTIAAVIFTAFNWGRLPIPARGGIMLAATVLTGWVARLSLRRELTSSAEAISVLAFLLSAIDAYALRRANVAGLAGTDAATYWSVASGVLAVVIAGYARLVPVASARYGALAAAQLPLVITAVRLDGWTYAERGVLLVAQAAALLVATRWLRGLALAARVAGVGNWAAAVLLAGTTAYAGGSRADVRAAAFVLVLAAGVAQLWPDRRTISSGVSTALVVLGVVAVARDGLTTVQLPAAAAAVGLLAVVFATAVRDLPWRDGPLAVGAATVGVAFAAVAVSVATAVVGPFGWLEDVWGLGPDVPVRAALAPELAWSGTIVTVGVAGVAALTLVLLAEVLDRRAALLPYVVALGAATVLVTPLGFAWPYRVAVAWDVAAGVAGLVLTVLLRRPLPALVGSVVLTVATAWSLASEGTTVAVLAVVTAAYAAFAAAHRPWREASAGVAAAGAATLAFAVAASRGAPVDRIGFSGAVAACFLVAAAALLDRRTATVVECVAATAYVVGLVLATNGIGWLAWTLGAGAVTAAALASRADRRWVAGVAALLGATCAAATSAAYGAPAVRTGFVAAAAGCALVALAGRLRLDDVAVVGAGAYVLGTLFTAGDPGWLSWALGAGAATAALDALRRPLAAPVSAALAIGCAATTSLAFGAAVPLAGFAAAVAGCAAVGVATLLRRDEVAYVGATGYVAGAVATGQDIGWLSWTLGAGAATAALDALRRPLAAPVSAALAIGCAATTSLAFGAAVPMAGFAAAVAGCAAVGVAALLRRDEVAYVGVTGYVAGAVAAGQDLGWLSWALGAGALTAAADAVRRRSTAPVAAAVAIACAGTTAGAYGLPVERVGYVVALAACAAVLAGTLLGWEDVAYVGGAGYLAGLAGAFADPGWLAWTFGTGAATVAAVALRRREGVPVATTLAILCAGTAAAAYEMPVDRIGFVVALAAAAAVGLGALLRGQPGDATEAVGGAAYVVAVFLSATDPGWLSWVLAVGGVTALADALREERRQLAWVGGALLVACSWDRLYLEEVRSPEAYAAPLAAIALTLGHLRRQRDDSVGSWQAYGPGLATALLPSLWIAVTDPGLTRPLLLGVASLVVLLAGVKERLQAPLTLGAGVLVVDALVQLAPVAAGLPKWASIGAAGLLVIAVGMTYEQRRRDVARLRETFDAMT